MRLLLKAIFTPLLILAVLFTLVNSCDRRPDPGIEEFLSAAPEEPPMEENAYFALLGHNVGAGLDPFAEGVRIAGEVEEKGADNWTADDMFREDSLGSPALPVSWGDGTLEEAMSGEYLTLAFERAQEVRTLVGENRELVDRYRDLYRYRSFGETTPFAFLIDSLAPLKETQKVALFSIALESAGGEVDAAIAALEEDVRLWRMVLGGTQHLVNKMVAVAALGRTVRLIAEMANRFGFDGGQTARIRDMFQPLTEEERSLLSVMRGELAYQLQVLSKIPEDIGPKSSALFKENATRNLVFKRFLKDIDVYGAPAPEWARRWEPYREARKQEPGILYWPKLFYNPVGRIIADISTPDFLGFQAKVHDLDGYFNLLKVHLEVRRAGVGPEEIPAFMEESCPELCEPYSLQAFSWNAGEETIFFMSPLSEKPRSLAVH